MKYIIVLTACLVLFAQCRRIDNDFPNKTVENISKYDTLGLQWLVCEREHIIYYFQYDSVDNISTVFEYTNERENAYKYIDEIFKAKLPQPKIRFFVWFDPELAEQKLDKKLGFAIPPKCECQNYVGQTPGHEMAHIITYWAGGIEPTSYSRFVNEGVAVAFDLSGRDKIAEAKAALAGQAVNSVEQIWYYDESVPEETLYPVAGAFMEFLYKKNQPEKFHALIKSQTIADAETIYGTAQLQALIDEFDSLVGL